MFNHKRYKMHEATDLIARKESQHDILTTKSSYFRHFGGFEFGLSKEEAN